ncbi:nucleotidyltransferase family protein [Roseomonas nepalensis]|uniref:Nucleotidyltransferase family protein n=1 Tax=Muricoccus nepalensis TaxID=1854500 RepID=A0A502FKL1_9PROT|nr:nucleotidyltransferase family protein [Roseomonas nepalensis]TPG49633.1 nucleotidyltransferase family protein [Roseomonas nepalensis]
MPSPEARIGAILRADPRRWHLLDVARALGPPDGWIGAGFVRNAVWDHRHHRAPLPPTGDVDVVWHDPFRADPAEDRRHEAALRAAEPSVRWSVKNQARMHARNGDAPYASVPDAMRHWPETATAVAARRSGPDGCDIAAPFGVDDLLNLVLRPTPAFLGAKRAVYEERQRSKQWTALWPLLREA